VDLKGKMMQIEFVELKTGTGQRQEFIAGLSDDDLKLTTIVTQRVMMAFWTDAIANRLQRSVMPTLMTPVEWAREPKHLGLVVIDDLYPSDFSRVAPSVLDFGGNLPGRAIILGNEAGLHDAVRQALADELLVWGLVHSVKRFSSGVSKSLIAGFDANGYSTHSARGDTVGMIVEHCRANKWPFRVEAGYIDGKIVGMRVVQRSLPTEQPDGIEVKVLYDSELPRMNIPARLQVLAAGNDTHDIARMHAAVAANPVFDRPAGAPAPKATVETDEHANHP
jgi:hypothetical protein